MLFRKSAQNKKPSGRVAIIGNSPLAFFLAYLLQNNNFEVFFLTTSSKLPAQSVSVTLKTDSFQTKHFFVNYKDTLPFSVDFYCIASSPDSYKKDFLLIQSTSLKDIPILNFSYIYNRHLFEEKKDLNLIPVYSTCWLNFEKNTLEVLSGKTVFEICCPIKNFGSYETLFKNPFVETKNISNSKPSLWQHLIPFILSHLFIASYKKDFLFHLKQKDVREQILNALRELCALAKQEKEEVKESDVLAFLYTIPDEYKSKFSNPLDLSVLASLVPQLSYFDTPALYKLFSLANKS